MGAFQSCNNNLESCSVAFVVLATTLLESWHGWERSGSKSDTS
jgi:hypothetical protein